MCKKIANFWHTVFTYPTPARAFLILFPFAILLFIVLYFIPWLYGYTLCIVLLFFFGSIFIYNRESKKEEEKRNLWTSGDYFQKHYSYILLVKELSQEEHYTVKSFQEDWVKNFDKCIYEVIGNRFQSKLNDFDIAACFIYAFLLCHCSDEELAFVFKCAKRIIQNPKSYKVTYSLGGEFQLEERKSFKGCIFAPDKEISIEAILAILRAYFLPVNSTGISQLSDFLHVLFLRDNQAT